MASEAYTPPTAQATNIHAPTTQIGGATTSSLSNEQSRPVRYICGQCNSKVTLRRSDVVRCGECGHRVLYKERTNRMVQFEAR